MNKITLKTPCCDRVVRGSHKTQSATLVLSRVCPRCRTSYRVRVSPIYCGSSVNVHEVLWVPTINRLCSHKEVLA